MSDKKNKPTRPKKFNVLTFSTPCPSCGGTVEFASAGSVMSVCEYCQTSVVREGDAIKAQGKQSLVIEDYSPLQIGSSGRYGKHEFTLVGRIQYEYEDGVWNEWYISFNNGKSGWLSEALGHYSITLDKGVHPNIPKYHELNIRDKVAFDDDIFTVSDKRTAKAIAGEGELPVVMNEGWQTWVIDARFKRKFITLDYENETGDASVFEGIAVSLEQLGMQFLKDTHQQAHSSNLSGGDDEGKNEVGKIDCPNCGGPIPNIPGTTSCLICPSCHSEVALKGEQAELVTVHSMMQTFPATLKLGDKARLKDSDLAYINEFNDSDNKVDWENKTHDYVVIGIQRMREVGEFAQWTEYLLYSFTDGFLWIAEEPGGWFISRVINEMPETQGRYLIYRDKKWHPEFDESYQSQVRSAIGAFNWKVNTSDKMTLTDYRCGSQTITVEENASEVTYTISSQVSIEQINAWFGKSIKPLPKFSSSKPKSNNKLSLSDQESEEETLILIGIVIIIVIFAFLNSSTGTSCDESEEDCYSSSSSTYYSSGSDSGRTGYTSSGSHK